MGIGTNTNERKPVATVTVGSVAIPIYAAPVMVRKAPDTDGAAHAEGRTYQSFQVAHYEGARRVLQRRNTLDKAKALAKQIASRLSRDGARAQFFTEKDRRIYTLAQLRSQSLGLEVDEICRRYAELQERLKTGTLDEAVSFYLAHQRNENVRVHAQACTEDNQTTSPPLARRTSICNATRRTF
jgi:hypothetical protein